MIQTVILVEYILIGLDVWHLWIFFFEIVSLYRIRSCLPYYTSLKSLSIRTFISFRKKTNNSWFSYQWDVNFSRKMNSSFKVIYSLELGLFNKSVKNLKIPFCVAWKKLLIVHMYKRNEEIYTYRISK